MLFEGYDASGKENPWVTDGTVAGTSELTAAGASLAGLLARSNPDFTVLGSIVLFVGDDASGHAGLWVTDGTSAGTAELTVNGAFSTGVFAFLADPFFTVLGGKALFVGDDTNRHPFLWATDGTSAGTSELAVAGAFFGGLFGSGTGAIDPGFTILGGKALFEGYDANDLPGLWVSDGTSAGTSEVVVAGVSGGGLFSVGVVPDLTVLGGKALFEGQDARGRYNFWVTDGTSAGTSELTVTGANPTRGLSPEYLTVLGGKALFAGDDASGHTNLWITDGTSAGTSELTLAGAYSNGLFYAGGGGRDLDPGFTISGGKALFVGKDASGAANLWVTDGTAAGTSELIAAGAFPSGLLPAEITLLASPSPSSDFNGDGYSDILFQNGSGEAVIWELNGTAAAVSAIRGRAGIQSVPAILTATVMPTSCGRTAAAKSSSGS